MNVGKIRECIARTERNETALKWLLEYGIQLDPQADRQSFVLAFSTHFAGSCHGSKEASEVLSAMARLDIARLVSHAIENCRNTIEMDRAAIHREVEASGAAS